jgi:hypothetical protein
MQERPRKEAKGRRGSHNCEKVTSPDKHSLHRSLKFSTALKEIDRPIGKSLPHKAHASPTKKIPDSQVREIRMNERIMSWAFDCAVRMFL